MTLQSPYILLIGSFPPPIGGISVHVERLQLLLEEKDQRVIVLDLYGKSSPEDDNHNVIRIRPVTIKKTLLCLRLIASRNCKLIHFHVSAMYKFIKIAPFFLFLVKKRTKLFLTLHSGSFITLYECWSDSKRKKANKILQKFDALISVSQEQNNYLLNLGFDEEKLSVIPAFIPSGIETSSFIDQELNRVSLSSKKLLVSSGLVLPLYGFDKIIEAIQTDSRLEEKVVIFFCFYGVCDQNYISELKKLLKPEQDYAFFFDLSPKEFSYILSKTDIYIRATDRDGDAVAIREASFFNNQIIASDIVKRPDGVILFTLGDADSLLNCVQLAISDENEGLLNSDDNQAVDAIMNLYTKLLS